MQGACEREKRKRGGGLRRRAPGFQGGGRGEGQDQGRRKEVVQWNSGRVADLSIGY